MYTFIENLKYWGVVFSIWQSIELTDRDYDKLKKYVVLSSKYKRPQQKREKQDCGCK